jgi:hypothetical protein
MPRFKAKPSNLGSSRIRGEKNKISQVYGNSLLFTSSQGFDMAVAVAGLETSKTLMSNAPSIVAAVRLQRHQKP